MKLTPFLAIGSSLLWLAAPSYGCTCAPSVLPPGKNSIREFASARINGSGRTSTIFEGIVERQEVSSGSIGPPNTAMSMTPSGSHRIVTIRVSRVYRGTNREHFTVITGMGFGDCGFDFRSGEAYLVFADEIEGGAYFTSICAGTELLEHSGPTVRLLRGEAPSTEDVLDPDSYNARVLPQWTGNVCGRIAGPDGKPIKGATVELSEVRESPFPQSGGGEVSNADGTYCIKNVSPGKYLLTGEKNDFHNWSRLMGFYPGVSKHSEAISIEVKAQTTITATPFKLHEESLYDIRIRVVTLDGSSLPWKRIGVAVQSPDRDPLSYHINHGVEEDGSYRFGYIPAGHYTVRSYAQPDFDEDPARASVQAFDWRQDEREVDVIGNTEVILKIAPKK